MLVGPITRLRKSEKRYKEYQKVTNPAVCQFCEFAPGHAQLVEETPYFWVVENIFGYDLWEGCGVLEHLMLVPKRHILALKDFTKAEVLDYMQLIARFEDDGYALYTRPPASITRSVPHHHTHFIKIDNKRKNSLFYLRKPHVMIYR